MIDAIKTIACCALALIMVGGALVAVSVAAMQREKDERGM